MSTLSFLKHLLAFFAPAPAVALGLVLLGQLMLRAQVKPRGWLAPMALLTVLGCAVLLAGLWLLGSDGRMATWAALVLVLASAHWLQLRAWR
ncbi:hypothetical protein [Comamonas sp. NLF-1-9]|uniref:hypothetical protein n=1 Tax=Comamonas sp. NLF-1-9 TaxID=2853163 RepID=UPI001C47DCE6|nr:hypothetical protein [Comamonas sp. NLF-1-9]QXL85470.1 hypothetical protein KUD94_05770 [Comamonas sp. NLF-1-9]